MKRLLRRARRAGVLAVATLLLAAPARAEDKGPREDPNPDFVKGELTSLGVNHLQVHNMRAGAELGFAKIGTGYYALLVPNFDLAIGDLGLGVSGPLRVLLYDPGRGLRSGFVPDGVRLRKEDYDELSEIGRILRYFHYGTKESNLYVNVGTETTATLGHGAGMRRYIANIDVDRARVSGEVDAYGRYGGLELIVGDLLRPDRLFGALAFLKPFGGSPALAMERLSLGVHVAADLRAPWVLERGGDGKILVDENNAPKVLEASRAAVGGITLETKIYKSKDLDIKPWLDVSQFFGGPQSQGGRGLTLGVLGRANFGKATSLHALRAIAEARAFQGNYLPSYFDTFYEIQRFQYMTGHADPSLPTKLWDVVHRTNELHYGYYLEAQWAWVDRVAVTAAWEDSDVKGGRNAVLHVEVPAGDRLKLFGSAHRRSVEGRLLDVIHEGQDQLSADNTAFWAGARVKLMSILFLNLRAWREWKMDAAAGTYSTTTGWQGTLELGYEWDQ